MIKVRRAVSDLARRFFERTLPTKAAQELHRLFQAEGSIAFKVGRAGWTFRFRSVEPVVPRFDREAQLQLWFSDNAFADFLAGTLDLSRAIRTRAVRAQGDVSLLEVFGRFLQPESAGLGWDALP